MNEPAQEQIREQIIACGGILPYLELIQKVASEFDPTIAAELENVILGRLILR